MYPTKTQSIRSSTSSEKCDKKSEVARLQAEIGTLKQTIDMLNVTVETRDLVIDTLAREKEKLYLELKSAQKTNRNLHQQLSDERDMHSKEKEYFNEEINRLAQKDHGEFQTISLDNNLESNISFREEIRAKDQVIYNIGEKYFKMKSNKKCLQKKLKELESQSKKICEEIVLLLQDNRGTLDDMLDALVKSSKLSPSTKKYLQLLKNNAALHFENTQLKVVLAHIDLLQKNVGAGLKNWIDNTHSVNELRYAVTTDRMSEPKENLKQVEKQSLYSCNRYKSIFKHRRRFGAKLNSPMSCRHFKLLRVHEEFSQCYRWHLRCSKSDSYLICT